jgi:hypothetical protein
MWIRRKEWLEIRRYLDGKGLDDLRQSNRIELEGMHNLIREMERHLAKAKSIAPYEIINHLSHEFKGR